MTAASGVVALPGVVASPIVASGWSGHCCSGMQNVVKRGKNKTSLSSSYQAGGARRHVKQTAVVLTQAAKSASENTCSFCYLHTKGVVLHVSTYILVCSKSLLL